MKNFLILLSLSILVSCSGNLEKNRAKLDEVYGKCDNPSRTYTDKQYKQCVIAERAKGESLFGLKGDFNDLISCNSSIKSIGSLCGSKFAISSLFNLSELLLI